MSFSSFKWPIIIILLTIILSFLIVLTFKMLSASLQPSFEESVTRHFLIFDSVNASVTGKITKIEDKKMYFENQKGVTGEALLSDEVMVSNLSVKDPQPASSDLKQIELNKKTEMIFKIQNGKYIVTAITIPPQ